MDRNRKPRERPIVDGAAESEALAHELLALMSEKSNGDVVAVPLVLAKRIHQFLRPFGLVTLDEFGDFTPTEQALLAILLDEAPRFVPLNTILSRLAAQGRSMTHNTLMVHKLRLANGLLENNDRIKAYNDHRLEDEPPRGYSYLIAMNGAGYVVVRHDEYFRAEEIKKVNWGIYL